MSLNDLFRRDHVSEPTAGVDLDTPLDRAPLAFLDVETTGLNAWAGHRICEIAIVRCVGKRETERLVSLVNPMRRIPADAQAVNCISDQMVAGAPPFASIAGQVARMLRGAVVVAHNAPFDLSFISREFGLVGLPAPTGPSFDTLVLARRESPGVGHSLGAVARRLHVRVPAHRALADVLTTREVFWRLVEPKLPREATIADALKLQGWRGLAGARLAADGDSAAVDSDVEALVRALRAGERLVVVYRSTDGRMTRRTIDPMVVVDQGEERVVVAYCHLRRAERTFTVSRIVSWAAASDDQSTGRPTGAD